MDRGTEAVASSDGRDIEAAIAVALARNTRL
jgi:hypothetical protein